MLFEYKKGFYVKAKSLEKAEKKLRNRNISFSELVRVDSILCQKIKKKIKRKNAEYQAFVNFLKEIALIYGKKEDYYLGKHKNKEVKRELARLKKHLIS